jgi:hypothetical protein
MYFSPYCFKTWREMTLSDWWNDAEEWTRHLLGIVVALVFVFFACFLMILVEAVTRERRVAR